MSPRKGSIAVGAVVALVLMAMAGPLQVGAQLNPGASPAVPASLHRGFTDSSRRGTFGSALVASAPVAIGPSAVAVDTATDTIYTANGLNANGPTNPGGDTVSVIDGRLCQAQAISRCKGPWPTIKVGNLPSTISVDQATDTVYVTIFGKSITADAVAVFNGAICNGHVTWGCDQTPARVRVGSAPFGIFADSANHTVYVDNPGPSFTEDTISMIDSSTCDAMDLSGCATHTPPRVTVGAGPGGIAVDQSTHTVYVAVNDGVSAFDANTCNAEVQAGCGTVGMLNGASVVSGVTVDAANDTIYTADFSKDTMSAFDGRSCNASDLAGCAAEKPGIVVVGPPLGFEVAFALTVDVPLHTVYVLNQKDDDLSVINTDVCNGGHLAACATLTPPTIHTGQDPEAVVVDPRTQTVYTANQLDNDVSVIDARRCDADDTSGCRHPAPAVSLPESLLPAQSDVAVDTAVHTAYATTGAHAVAMIDTDTCNAERLVGCAATPPTVSVGAGPEAVAVDQSTRTVYVANHGGGSGGTVAVINAGTCDATHATGCTGLPALRVPAGHPDGIAVNTLTDTIYVATIPNHGPDLIAVFNGRSCNASHTSGCNQKPALIAVGHSGGGASELSLAIDQDTDTIYATNLITPASTPFVGDKVYVINGASCNAVNTSGCGQLPATITAGSNPWGIAVDEATDTIYTANIATGEGRGTVSVIDGATCNGSDTTGCGQIPYTAAAGFGALAVAVDVLTDRVYVTNIEDTSVSVINGAACNAGTHAGCGQSPPSIAVGRAPDSIAIDDGDGSAYITNGDNTVSVIPLLR
jgi:DNA-binding beta-propeller fold protein YncE